MSDKDLTSNGFLAAQVNIEDDIVFGANYGLIQWVNGRPTGQKGTIQETGGFFFSGDQGMEPPPGFKPFTLMTQEGEEIEGFASETLNFSPIRFRRCWEVSSDDDGYPTRYAWNDYETAKADGKPTGVCHIVVSVDGGDEPLMLSFRGMTSKAMMGMGRDRGVIPSYGSLIVGAASRLFRTKHKTARKFPLCAFQLTVGPEIDGKGKPVYTKVGSGTETQKITMPVWRDAVSGLVDEKTVERLYVGHESFADYQAIFQEADDWANAWTPEVLYKRAAAPSAPVPVGNDGTPGAQEVPY